MDLEYIPFKVGQRWKTRTGQRFIIKEIHDDDDYPLVCISMESGKKHFFDEDGQESPLWPTDNDLVECISENTI
jgi:hypothetical protein